MSAVRTLATFLLLPLVLLIVIMRALSMVLLLPAFMAIMLLLMLVMAVLPADRRAGYWAALLLPGEQVMDWFAL